jgi:uncharacterized protein involved in outer membrane biogenesis
MLKKVLIGVVALTIVASVGLFFWVRAVFTQENVRATIASQLSTRLGQPVTIGSIGASIYPRVTMNLRDVAIGQPQSIRIATLHVGTDVRALLSRRIEHASLRLDGARIELPLPDFAILSRPSESDESPTTLPVEIVSVDEIVLQDVQITSGGRTLHGDIELEPHGKTIQIRKIKIGADEANIEITGQITDLSGPTGELAVKSGQLNFDRLLAFVSDFAAKAGIGSFSRPSTPRSASGQVRKPTTQGPAMNLALSLDADRATMGALSLERLNGRARLTSDSLTLDPIRFGLFDGNYQGVLTLTLGNRVDFKLNATLSRIDMTRVMTFAGSPDTLTGRLSGNVAVAGRGMTADSVLETARGRGRVDITNGRVKRLGLVRTVVLASSGRTGGQPMKSDAPTDEPFERLGATLTIANGSAFTEDLRFESEDLLLTAAGVIRLDGSAINLRGDVQLSDELSQQAGRDLVRYTQNQGRVTLPATITGSADKLVVRIDVASVAKRAIANRASEEIRKGVKKGLDRLLGR